MSRATELFWRLLPAVRRAERTRALFFTALLALVMAAQTVGLAGSEALFLAELSAQRLPLAFVIASLVTVAGSLLYAVRVGAARNDSLFAQMLLGAGAALAGVPWLAPDPGPVLLFALLAGFYLTQSVFINHYWTFAGDYFDTPSSKRLFPVFLVGSSVGGLLGGVAGALSARAAGPLAPIALWGALLCAAAALLRLARQPLRRWGPLGLEEADETSVEGIRGAIAHLRGSLLGRWLVLSALGMVLALFVAQYIYSDLFVRAHPDPADLAVFIATYLAVTNLLEIALELWVTPWWIRRFGVASAHAAHPVLTLASFAGLFASPGLATAVLARANRELVENALAQPVRTLVFNALPARLRGRIRAFLEGIVVNGGMSLAGLLLLALDAPDLRLLALGGGGAALLYLAANLGVRRAYLRALVAGIRSGRLELADLDSGIGGWEATRLADLCDELLGVEAEQPSPSLRQLITSLGQRGIHPPLLRGCSHASAQVRAECVRALAGSAEAGPALRRALGDPDPLVRRAAIAASAGNAHPATEWDLAPLLEDPDPRVRAAAASVCPGAADRLAPMLASGDREERLAALAVADARCAAEIARCARDPDPAVCAAALERLAAVTPHDVPAEAVAAALEHTEAGVRCAALRAAAGVLEAVGGARVAEALRDPSPTVRKAAAAALAAGGAGGAEAARPYLSDEHEATAVAAFDAVGGGDPPRRRELLAAELRRRVALAWAAIAGTAQLPADGPLPARFLHAAAADAVLRHRRVAFRALELLESPRVVRRVERALRFGTARARGDALEVLSNLGDREAARWLALMHEAGPLAERMASLGPAVRVAASRAAFLAEAGRAGDPWLQRAVAAASGDGETPHPELRRMDRLLALKRVPLFESLSLDQLDAVQRLARDETFVAGEVIVREGEPGGELYCVLEGSAEAWLDHGGPRSRRLSRIGAGGYFGEMAILDDEPRSATVVACESTQLLALDGDSLKALVLQMPEIAFALLRVMSARVRASERRLLEASG